MQKVKFLLAALVAIVGVSSALANAKVFNQSFRYSHTGVTYSKITTYSAAKCNGQVDTHCSYILVLPDGQAAPATFTVQPPGTISLTGDAVAPLKHYTRP